MKNKIKIGGFIIILIIISSLIGLRGFEIDNKCNTCTGEGAGFSGYTFFNYPIIQYMEPYDILKPSSIPSVCTAFCTRSSYDLSYGLLGLVISIGGIYLIFRLKPR